LNVKTFKTSANQLHPVNL